MNRDVKNRNKEENTKGNNNHNKRPCRELLKRLFVFTVGLYLMAAGVSFMVYAELGTSPISSVPYVFSLKFTGISLGTFTFLWNILIILCQILILQKDFKLYQLWQIPLSVAFGVFVDFNKYLMRNIIAEKYIIQILLMVLGCLVLAAGVMLMTAADLVLNSAEALVQAVCFKSGKNFGNMKVVFDTSFVILASLVSWVFFGKIAGVREGTIIAAVSCGFIVRFLASLWKARIITWERK